MLCAALPAAAWLLARGVLQDEPSVSVTAEIAPTDIAHMLALVRAHDPRRVPPGQLSAVVLNERDLDVLINHFAYRRLGVPARVSLTPGTAELQASLHLPANPFGRWLNVRARVLETPGLPRIAALQVGRLPLPAWLAVPLLRRAADRAGLHTELAMAAEVVRRVNFQPQQLTLSYVLRADSAERFVAAVVPPAEQQRLRAYSDQLVALAAAPNAESNHSLARWIGPMFELARQRSQAGGDAAAENRAAIVALTLYANGRSLDRLLPAARHWPQPQAQRLTLAGRDDSPLHLLISAALAVKPAARCPGPWACTKRWPIHAAAAASASTTWPPTAPARAWVNWRCSSRSACKQRWRAGCRKPTSCHTPPTCPNPWPSRNSSAASAASANRATWRWWPRSTDASAP